jgi:hypothetical protein
MSPDLAPTQGLEWPFPMSIQVELLNVVSVGRDAFSFPLLQMCVPTLVLGHDTNIGQARCYYNME